MEILADDAFRSSNPSLHLGLEDNCGLTGESRPSPAKSRKPSTQIAQRIWMETLRDRQYAGTMCRGVLNAQVSIR